MSKVIGVHFDGSDCFTPRCRNRKFGVDKAGRVLSEKLDVVDKAVMLSPYERALGLVKHVEKSFGRVKVSLAGVDDCGSFFQQEVNSLADSLVGGKVAHIEAAKAYNMLLELKGRVEEYGIAGYDMTVEVLRAGVFAGAYRRAALLADDLLFTDVNRYVITYCADNVVADVFRGSNIEEILDKHHKIMSSSRFSDNSLFISCIRAKEDGDEETVLSNNSGSNELLLHVGDEVVVPGRTHNWLVTHKVPLISR